MVDERQLTEHFSLYELTKTTRDEFQEKNRDVSEAQIAKLTELARLLEHVRFVLGVPITVSSGYRCTELNAAVGSTDRSQHLLCEAADIVPGNLELEPSFRRLWEDVKNNGTNVGQLIWEKAQRSYGVTEWLHISLGTPYRDDSRCKQILIMENGKYERLA